MIDYQFLLICAVIDTIVIFPLGFIAGYMPIVDEDRTDAFFSGVLTGVVLWFIVLVGCYLV